MSETNRDNCSADADYTIVATESQGPSGITPLSLKHLALVERVMEQLGAGCQTISLACARAGTNRTALWRALEDPWVQQRTISLYHAGNAATIQLIDQNWVPVLLNLIDIATSSKDKEAVQAARLLVQLRKETGEAPEIKTRGEREISPARALLQGMQKPRTLRRQIITEEIELDGSR